LFGEDLREEAVGLVGVDFFGDYVTIEISLCG